MMPSRSWSGDPELAEGYDLETVRCRCTCADRSPTLVGGSPSTFVGSCAAGDWPEAFSVSPRTVDPMAPAAPAISARRESEVLSFLLAMAVR